MLHPHPRSIPIGVHIYLDWDSTIDGAISLKRGEQVQPQAIVAAATVANPHKFFHHFPHSSYKVPTTIPSRKGFQVPAQYRAGLGLSTEQLLRTSSTSRGALDSPVRGTACRQLAEPLLAAFPTGASEGSEPTDRFPAVHRMRTLYRWSPP